MRAWTRIACCLIPFLLTPTLPISADEPQDAQPKPEKAAESSPWITDAKIAKAQSLKEKKDLLIYFSGSDWVKHCQLLEMLESGAFAAPEFLERIQKTYVLLYLDFPKGEEALAKVEERIDKWVGRKNRCENASDCVHIDTSTGCRGTCGAFVNAEKRDKVASKLERADEKFCTDYIGDGCPYSTPSCVPREAVCIEGRCVVAPP